MNSSRPYIARALYEWLVDNDLTPQIVVDAEVEGVEVPRDFVVNGQIVLNVGVSAVGEFEMNNEAIVFSARFGGKATRLMVPMPALLAIYARENGVGMVFGHEPEMPLEEPVLEADERQPTLGLVGQEDLEDPENVGGRDEATSRDDATRDSESNASSGKPSGRPTLRVVK
ncbi:ClpXP protease specificity-enhancing factor [Halomonas halocynthiae]|uniref:ClpXP protease specificity-enhancing factor n=1 Tax=Halomonas halocynthiae TaxID=176290 RepID=UPI00048321F5|nr:ClpXP protease specificity-enhancing factor [Halomonas halocynthiae]